MELTNSWYFDVMVYAARNLRSSALPESSIIGTPKTEAAINDSFERFIHEIFTSERK